MKTNHINTGDYFVQVGKGFINSDDTLIVTTDVSELCDRSAIYYKDEAEEKIEEFGGKLYEVVLVERELN